MAQKITPFLWFDNDSEEAMNFYVNIFNSAPYSKKDSKIVSIARYEKGVDTPQAAEMEEKVITGIFELAGQRFMCLDGGPVFKFSESVSLYIECEDQKEVDYFWEKLSAFPDSEQCGWLKDKFGLSWQIIPKRMTELMQEKDKEKAHRVANAMLKMHKIVIDDLEKAAEQK